MDTWYQIHKDATMDTLGGMAFQFARCRVILHTQQYSTQQTWLERKKYTRRSISWDHLGKRFIPIRASAEMMSGTVVPSLCLRTWPQRWGLDANQWGVVDSRCDIGYTLKCNLGEWVLTAAVHTTDTVIGSADRKQIWCRWLLGYYDAKSFIGKIKIDLLGKNV